MIDRLEQLLTARRRKYLYRIATAALALAATYGLINGDQVAALLYLAAAVTGMADTHTDPAPRRAIEQ